MGVAYKNQISLWSQILLRCVWADLDLITNAERFTRINWIFDYERNRRYCHKYLQCDTDNDRIHVKDRSTYRTEYLECDRELWRDCQWNLQGSRDWSQRQWLLVDNTVCTEHPDDDIHLSHHYSY